MDQRIKLFRVPAWRKLINYIKECRALVLTKDNNEAAINTVNSTLSIFMSSCYFESCSCVFFSQLNGLVADYYRQLADDMLARGRKSYDRAHPYDMNEHDRKTFKDMHDLYYPRRRKDILAKNIAVDMDDPAGIATEYLKMIKNRRIAEGDDVFLSYSPLADIMAVNDAQQRAMAQRRSASP